MHRASAPLLAAWLAGSAWCCAHEETRDDSLRVTVEAWATMDVAFTRWAEAEGRAVEELAGSGQLSAAEERTRRLEQAVARWDVLAATVTMSLVIWRERGTTDRAALAHALDAAHAMLAALP